VHIVGFIIRIYHDVRSSECQNQRPVRFKADRHLALSVPPAIRTGFYSRKVKQSHYRPGQAQRVPGSKVPRFRDNGTRMLVGCQSHAPAAFTPQEILLVIISVRG